MADPATFRDWLASQFDDAQLEEIAEHGSDAGWEGLEEPEDAAELYRLYSDDVWDVVAADMEEEGIDDFPAWLLRAKDRSFKVGSRQALEHWLVTFAAEQVAAELAGVEEEEEDEDE